MSDTVKITFEIDGVEYSISQLKEMGKEAAGAGSEIESASKTAGEASKAASKEVGLLGKSFSGIKSIAKGLKADFMNGFNAVKQFATGLGLSSKAAGVLAVSLSALGIPLILAAVAALIEYFKNFEGGVKILTTTLNVIGNVIANIVEAFQKLLTLNFRGFFGQLKKTGDVIKDTISNTNALFEAEKRLEQLNLELTLSNAKLRREYELANKVVNDNTASYEERREALNEMARAEEQLLDNAIKIAQAERDILERQLALENNYKKRAEIQQQLTQLTADLIEQETQLELKRYNAERRIRALNEEQQRNALDASKRAADLQNKFLEARISLEQRLELTRIVDLEAREKRRLEIERDNQIRSIKQAEYSETQKAILIKAIREQADLDELARQKRVDDEATKAREEREKASFQRMFGLQNEIDLLRTQDRRERDALRLKQQQETLMAELAQLEYADELMHQARVRFRLLQQEQEARWAEEDEIERIANLEQDIDNMLTSYEILGNITIAQREEELERARAYFAQLLADETLTAKQREAIEKKRGEVMQMINQDIQLSQQALLAAVRGTLGEISGILGQATAAGKAFAIADAIANTWKAANIALASAPPPAGAIRAAAVAAAGLANVKKIMSTKPGRTSGGGSASPRATTSGDTATRVTPDISQVFGAIQSTLPQVPLPPGSPGADPQGPLKAFVISGEISNAQEADKRVEELAKL